MRSVAFLVLVGCTAEVPGIEGRKAEPDKGTPEQNGVTSITLSQYFDEIAGIYCEQSFQCRATFPVDRGYSFETQWGATLDECTARLVTGWDPALVETEIAKGRITYDGSAAVSCLEGVAFAACGEYWTRGIDWAESCYHVIVGTVPTGGVCESSYSCTSYQCDTITHKCL